MSSVKKITTTREEVIKVTKKIKVPSYTVTLTEDEFIALAIIGGNIANYEISYTLKGLANIYQEIKDIHGELLLDEPIDGGNLQELVNKYKKEQKK